MCRALVGVSLAVCLAGAYLTVFALLEALLAGDRPALSAAVAAGVDGRRCSSRSADGSARGVDRLYYGDRADPYAVTTRLAAALAAPASTWTGCQAVVCRDGRRRRCGCGAAEAGPRSTARSGRLGQRPGIRRASARALRAAPPRRDRSGWLVVCPALRRAAARHERDAVDPCGRSPTRSRRRWLPCTCTSELQRSREAAGLGPRGRAAPASARPARRPRREPGRPAASARDRPGPGRRDADRRPPCWPRAGDASSRRWPRSAASATDLRPPGIDDLGLAARPRGPGRAAARRPGSTVALDVDDAAALRPARSRSPSTGSSPRPWPTSPSTRRRRGSTYERASRSDGVDARGAPTTASASNAAGASADRAPGSALDSMRQRAEEIGGALTLRAADPGGGTERSGELPLTVGGPR